MRCFSLIDKVSENVSKLLLDEEDKIISDSIIFYNFKIIKFILFEILIKINISIMYLNTEEILYIKNFYDAIKKNFVIFKKIFVLFL